MPHHRSRYGRRMRRLALVGLLLLLAGCVPTPAASPSPVPTPTTAAPIFASEEEALAAAETAYAAYQAAVDASLQNLDDGGLTAVASGIALSQAKESVATFQREGKQLIGLTNVRTLRVVQTGGLLSGAGDPVMQIYGCIDTSSTDVVDPQGTSVVASDRRTSYPTVITLEWSDDRLRVNAVEVWEGDDFCA